MQPSPLRAWRARLTRQATPLGALLCSLLGCATLGCDARWLRPKTAPLHVQTEWTDTQKPATVRMLLVVNDHDKPLVGLGPWNFKVYEDNIPLTSPDDLSIVGTDLSAKMFTVVLLDWSGKVAGSPDAAATVDAVAAFASQIRARQQLAVYAFDGSPDLHPVFAFGATDKQVKAGLDALRDYRPQDPTGNLNAGMAAGLKALRAGMGEHDLLSRGVLIVVYREVDRAGRVTRKDLDELLLQPQYASMRRLLVGVGEPSRLAQLGGDEATYLAAATDLKTTLDGFVTRIAELSRSYYYLVVCSGARSGQHEIRVDVSRKVKGDKGNETQQAGTLRQTFVADGFGPGCKPTLPDEIQVLAPEELPPEPSAAPATSAPPPAASAPPSQLH